MHAKAGGWVMGGGASRMQEAFVVFDRHEVWWYEVYGFTYLRPAHPHATTTWSSQGLQACLWVQKNRFATKLPNDALKRTNFLG